MQGLFAKEDYARVLPALMMVNVGLMGMLGITIARGTRYMALTGQIPARILEIQVLGVMLVMKEN